MSETRLFSFALITIHREITMDIENILRHFGIETAKIGNSTLILYCYDMRDM